MSFDLFYRPCRFGSEPVEVENPFTGEVHVALPTKPLTPRDQEAIRDVLRGNNAAEPDQHGCYLIECRDGGAADVYAGHDLKTGCIVTLTLGLTPDLLRFLFDLLRAADWVMLPAMEGNPTITALAGRGEGYADDGPEVVCNSAEELGIALAEGFEGWRRYKDQILGSPRGVE